MRELKFKIYDKNDTKGIIGPFAWNKLPQFLFPENFTVLQYTGLKDKNGKEIYEGDILFFQQQDGVWSNQLNKHIEVKYPFVCGNAHLGEIIGNIFENSELLNQ